MEMATPNNLPGFATAALVLTSGEKARSFVESSRSERRERLAKLSTLTNSKAFREELAQVAKEGGDHAALTMLQDLLNDATNVSIDELRFVRRLGEGGFAFVDLYEKGVGEGTIRYAVKVMKDKMTLPPLEMHGEPRVVAVPDSDRLRFLTEAVLMTNLKDEHVVGCYGIVAEPLHPDGTRPPPKLLQEFCADGNLLDRIHKPRYDAATALKWLKQTALGLACLHETGGMHRDLKPENVLLKDGIAKVADFGLFRLELDEPFKAELVEPKPLSAENDAAAAHAAPAASHDAAAHDAAAAPDATAAPDAPAHDVASPVAASPGSPSPGSPSPGSPSRMAPGSPSRKPRRLTSFPTLGRGSSFAIKRRVQLQRSTREHTSQTGTMRYMAPEMYAAGAATGSSAAAYTNAIDVFSFAILAYELLGRRRAYVASSTRTPRLALRPRRRRHPSLTASALTVTGTRRRT